jgi:hypothetical protein
MKTKLTLGKSVKDKVSNSVSDSVNNSVMEFSYELNK